MDMATIKDISTENSGADGGYLSNARKKYGLKDDEKITTVNTTATIEETGEDETGYIFTARIAANCLDREGEVVLPAGVDTSVFRKCGAIFWNHAFMENVEAKPIALPIPESIIQNEQYITCSARFLKRPKDWVGEFPSDFPREFVKQCKAAGISPGVSLTFVPTEQRKATKKDIATYGNGTKMVFSKSKLIEWSIAPLQSNPQCYIKALNSGLITKDIITQAGITIPEVIEPEVKIEAIIPIEPVVKKRIVYLFLNKSKTNEDRVQEMIAKKAGRFHI